MQKIFHLVYKSHGAELTNTVVTSIVKKSQIKNKKLGLTGILIYRQNTFIQLLEGEEQIVRELYSKISQDSRHKDVAILLESKSSLRLVPEWSMSYVNEHPDQATAQSLFELFDFITENNKADKSLIIPMLQKFGRSK